MEGYQKEMSYLAEHDRHTATDIGWSADVLYLESALGTVMIEACDRCPLLFVSCAHEKNVWEENERLICTLCGADGT